MTLHFARRVVTGVAAVLAVAAVGLVLRGVLPTSAAAPQRLPGTVAAETGPADFSSAAAASRKVPRGHSLVAAPKRRAWVRVYRRPGARRSRKLRQRIFEGQRIPLRFMVLKQRRGWVKVQLPGRPNRSSRWVRRRTVRLTTTPYRIVIRRRAKRLILFKDGRVVKRVRIAVGSALTPTPRGRYYVTDLIRSKDPFYGPYALGLSAHSPVLTSYAGGNGQLGIHGTSEPGSIGRDVSHGCIRVHNGVVRRLAKIIPLGTPVVIR